MNSMLQCLSHTRPLTDYFLRDEEGEPFYVRQINEKNPLGSGGDLARAYASFIRDAWSGSYSTVTPSALKRAVSGWKSQFSGYQQQDSQELMMALLDGLHENRTMSWPRNRGGGLACGTSPWSWTTAWASSSP